jgi:hypothetical protein
MAGIKDWAKGKEFLAEGARIAKGKALAQPPTHGAELAKLEAAFFEASKAATAAKSRALASMTKAALAEALPVMRKAEAAWVAWHGRPGKWAESIASMEHDAARLK